MSTPASPAVEAGSGWVSLGGPACSRLRRSRLTFSCISLKDGASAPRRPHLLVQCSRKEVCLGEATCLEDSQRSKGARHLAHGTRADTRDCGLCRERWMARLGKHTRQANEPTTSIRRPKRAAGHYLQSFKVWARTALILLYD